MAESKDNVRLPTEVVPKKYNVTVVPDLQRCTFQGYVEIDIEVVKSVSAITMHSLELTYPNAELIKLAGRRDEKSVVQTCNRYTIDIEHQRVTFHFVGDTVPPGAYKLQITYAGILNDKLAGFVSRDKVPSLRDRGLCHQYKAQYKLPNGKNSAMAVTQFEACDARRALPCWDEPAVKASYEVTIVAEPHFCAVSNMPVSVRSTTTAADGTAQFNGLQYDAGLAMYRYRETPVMSSYLLAFIVGEFDYISGFTKDHVEVRIYTPVGKSHLGRFSLDVAIGAIDFFNKYFDTPYPLPKLDLLAIPDFAAGAMENWGVITYRDTRLLVDPQNTSAASKQAVARTVCHEIAHMWFGNLVTMEWWTHLWLNEGFARFMEHKAVDKLFPDWNIWTQFVSTVYNQAMSLDGLESSHAIEVEVKHPDDIASIFDTISYAKGASVIRMLHDTIGGHTFMGGIRLYLKRFAYKNAKTDDLWTAISEASGKDVRSMMNTWIKRTGYPVVTVKEEPSNGTTKTLTLKQSRFLSTGVEEKSDGRDNWAVNLAVAEVATDLQQANVEHPITWKLFNISSGELSIPQSQWALTLNKGQAGFFRVHYPPGMLTALGHACAIGTLPPVDRLGLLGDIFALNKANRVPISQVLDLLKFFGNEQSFPVVEVISAELSTLLHVHDGQPYYPLLQKFVHRIFSPLFERLGWSDNPGVKEDHVTNLFRSSVLAMMGISGEQKITDEAVKRLSKFAEDEKCNPIPADLRQSIYNLAVRHGGQEAWDQVMSIYNRTELAEEKQRCMTAIGRSSDAAVLKRTIEWGCGKEVRKGDVLYVLGSVCSSIKGRELGWQYFRDNFQDFLYKYKGTGFILGHLVSAVLGSFCESSKADEFELFFKGRDNLAYERAMKQSIESVRSKALRLSQQRELLEAWLKKELA